MKKTVSIGSRRELFVDRLLIDTMDGVCLKLHPPVKREVVFQVNAPLENACSWFCNLFRDGNRILLYYRGYYQFRELVGDAVAMQTANLATSDDGIHFERPKLGLYEFEGSKENNIVLLASQGHNFCVFRDDNPEARPDQRYKAVGGGGKLFGFVSPDGIHWEKIQQEPLAITGAFDSINVPFWDACAGCYRLFSRYWTGGDTRIRAIQSCTSHDFIHWTKPEPHNYGEGVSLEHFYTNATVPCPGAEHILLSFPMRFVPERQKNIEGMDYPGEGLSDAVFMSSRDGVHWDRTFLEAWIRPDYDQRNWTHRSNIPAAGIIETAPGEWSMYVNEHYGWDDNRLRRVTLRTHRIASVNAGYAGGEFITHPVTFSGERLFLNYSTSAVGSIAVEVQDETGKPIQGLCLADMEPLYGDEPDAAISWKNATNLCAVAGRPVRFRFVLKDADLFALRTGKL